MSGTVRIAARFNGPPTTGNGGYSAGRLAAHVPERDGRAVRVRLRQPPPLERDLEVVQDGPLTLLRDGDAVIAEASLADLDLPVPAPPTLTQARTAAADRERPNHPFPTCFGCGPARDPATAVCALLSAVPGRDDGLFAAAWTPGAGLPHDAGGAVEEAIAWVALDCPSAQPVAPDGGPAHVLGTITAQVHAPIRVGVEHLLLAWPLGRDGRKAHSAAAVLTPDGTVCARSQALWIALG